MDLDEWFDWADFHWEVPCLYLRVSLAEEVVHLSGKRSKQLDASGVSEVVKYFLPVDSFSIVVQRTDALKCKSRIDSSNVVSQCWQFMHLC